MPPAWHTVTDEALSHELRMDLAHGLTDSDARTRITVPTNCPKPLPPLHSRYSSRNSRVSSSGLCWFSRPGGVFGPIRELWVAPHIARTGAVLLEVPLMLTVMMSAARWLAPAPRDFFRPQGKSIPG